MRISGLLGLGLCAALAATPAGSITVASSYKTVTSEAAKAMIAACEAWAVKNKLHLTVTVVDAAGVTVASDRMDGASIITTQMSPWKARTAQRWRRPSRWLSDQVKGGKREGVWEGDIAVQGGLPLLVDNAAIGAIGAAGGSSPQDEECSRTGIEAVMGKKAAEELMTGALPVIPAPPPLQQPR